MTLLEQLLAGIVIAFISGALGYVIGMGHKIDEETCNERRASCNAVSDMRLKGLESKIDMLIKAFKDNKLLSL